MDAIAYRVTQLWQKVAIAIKDSSSLEILHISKKHEVMEL